MSIYIIKTDVPCPHCGELVCDACLFNGMCQDCKTPFDAQTMEAVKSALDKIIKERHTMTIEIKKPSYSQGGYWEIIENGKKIGERRQYMGEGTSDITRTDHCQVHAWSESVRWAPSDEFPGDKSPKHWRDEHGADF